MFGLTLFLCNGDGSGKDIAMVYYLNSYESVTVCVLV